MFIVHRAHWQTVETPELQINFFVSNRNSDISNFGYGSHSVQKAVDFSTPAKNRIRKALGNQNFKSKCFDYKCAEKKVEKVKKIESKSFLMII